MFLIIADIASARATLSDIARCGSLSRAAHFCRTIRRRPSFTGAAAVIKLPAEMTSSGLFVVRFRASFDTSLVRSRVGGVGHTRREDK